MEKVESSHNDMHWNNFVIVHLGQKRTCNRDLLESQCDYLKDNPNIRSVSILPTPGNLDSFFKHLDGEKMVFTYETAIFHYILASTLDFKAMKDAALKYIFENITPFEYAQVVERMLKYLTFSKQELDEHQKDVLKDVYEQTFNFPSDYKIQDDSIRYLRYVKNACPFFPERFREFIISHPEHSFELFGEPVMDLNPYSKAFENELISFSSKERFLEGGICSLEPHTQLYVKGTFAKEGHDILNILDTNNSHYYVSEESPEQTIEFKINVGLLRATKYIIQAVSIDNDIFYPMAFQLYGSVNKIKWVLIDEQVNCTKFDTTYEPLEFNLKHPSRGYRYFMFVQNYNNKNDQYMYISHFNIFGYLLEQNCENKS